MSAKFFLENLDATRAFGNNISQIAEPNTVIALSGQLGSGKTTLTQAVAKGLQVEELVVSPTFVMINEYYSGRLPLYHLDLYRFLKHSKNDEVAKTDEPDINLFVCQLEEILQAQALVLIEWANILSDQFDLKLNNLCNSGYLSFDLQADLDNDQSRVITINAVGKRDDHCHVMLSNLCAVAKNFLRT